MAAEFWSSVLLVVLCITAVIGQAPPNGPIRLWRNFDFSLSFTSGRVQLRYNWAWGNICDSDGSFGITEATVVCHQLGFTGASSHGRARDDMFGFGFTALLSNVSCSTSSYLVILQCSYDTPPSSCTQNDDVSVTCFQTRIWDNPYSGQVRLTGGFTVNRGVVEVYCNGQWGTVCFESEQVRADTVCRQLGYGSAYRFSHLLVNSSSTQPIWIEDFNCVFRQPCLGNCVSCPSNSSEECAHSQDFAVVCYSNTTYTETTNETCINSTTIEYDTDACSSTLNQQRFQLMQENGKCEPYQGPTDDQGRNIVCDTMFIPDEDYVYIPNEREQGNQTRIRGFLGKYFPLLVPIQMSSPDCYKALSKALCVHYFLPCGSNGSIHVPQFLCSAVCSYIVEDVCREEWENLLSEFKSRISSERRGLDLPVCNNTSKIINYLDLSEDCCSNAEIVIPSPDTSTVVMVVVSNTPSKEAANTVVLISTSVAGASILLLAGVSIVCLMLLCILWKKKKIMPFENASESSSATEISEENGYIGLSPLTHHRKHADSNEEQHSSVISSYLRPLANFIVPKSQIKLIEILGKGEFGIVYRGLLLPASEGQFLNSKPEPVAIKTIKDGLSSRDTEAIMEESLKMKHFDHDNVLKLVGVCVDTGSAPYIIMPLMSHGSLLSYLVKERHNLTVAESSDIELVSSVQKQLLSMCLQISEGMAYLASQLFVHRDLAARNCMVAANGVIKVADFGLTEDMYQRKYFRQESNVRLPIKWMALESIHDMVFSEKSDVWSFGVTCWEVFSLGRSPYPAMGPTDVVDFLDGGSRLKNPKSITCSEATHEMMLSCWKDSPQDRPTFNELVQTLSDILKPLANYMDFINVYSRSNSITSC